METMTRKKAIGCSLIAIVILLVSQVIAGLLASLLAVIGVPIAICNALAGIIYLALVFISIKLFYEKVMHVQIAEFGISSFKLKWKWVLIGLLLPVAVSAFYLLCIPGSYVTSDIGTDQKLSILCAGIFFGGIGAGFVEEMVFRGVIFRSLEKAWNVKVAVIVPSLLFGIVHIIGMEFTVVSCILVIIAGTAVGIMFSLITIESGSVWCNAVAHALWNTIIIGGGLYISEKATSEAVVNYVLESKSFALTGGEFGIESSAIAVVAYVIVSVVAFLMISSKKKG